ncbi:MAG: STAS/SEC14 domain-containing protein [Planctomycetaceae bacterium]
MSVQLTEEAGGRILSFKVSDKLTSEDYQQFVPETERLIAAHGKIRLLFDMQDFHGWRLGALWEDVKFDLKHFRDIERLAMVGDRTWQKWMATFCRPFTSATIRYFDHDRICEAREWLSEGIPKESGIAGPA